MSGVLLDEFFTLNPFAAKTATKYSGALLERMTEHAQWVALGRILNVRRYEGD